MSFHKRTMLVVAAFAATLALGACNAAATPTPQSDAEKAVCTALQTWSDEMRTLTGLDASTASIEDVQAQRDAVASAWDDVKTALEGVQAADEAAVTAAGATLEAALQGFSTDIPVADAINEIKTAADPLKAAYKEMGNGMGCVFVTPY